MTLPEDARVATVKATPTLDELKDSDTQAQENRGAPIVLSWKNREDDPTYLLTVTYGVGMDLPTWILHVGDDADAAIVWIMMTSEVKTIHSMVKKSMNETGSLVIADATRTTHGGHKKKDTTHGGKKKDGKAGDDDEETPDTAFVRKGTVFAGAYEILSSVGHGGMGMVYKVKRKDDGKVLALKVLHPHLVSDNVTKARFEQEAESARELDHRNLIDVHEFGFSASGQPYIAMDFLDGYPLSDALKNGPLPLRRFISIFTQVCEGLNFAHSKGVVHRDIKPGNIMICRTDDSESEVAKIVDFGIAKTHITGTQTHLTPTGEVLGSPSYMSPEQCAGGGTDPRSDIYSLGCVMYEAAVGRLPFDDPSPIRVLIMQLSDPPPAFAKVAPNNMLPGEQERIIRKALEKDPARRYQTAEELGKDLWGLTVMGESGAVRVFGGDLRRPAGADAAPAMVPAPGTSDIVDAMKSAGKPKKMVTFRFKKMKSVFDKDMILQTLSLSNKLIKKGADFSILLDFEAVHLSHRSELMSPEFHPDLNTTEKIASIQSGLVKLIEAGATVAVAERWARYVGILSRGTEGLIPGVMLLNEDRMAEYLIQRAGSIMDYT
jgi:serine/threonine-protein kinase